MSFTQLLLRISLSLSLTSIASVTGFRTLILYRNSVVLKPVTVAILREFSLATTAVKIVGVPMDSCSSVAKIMELLNVLYKSTWSYFFATYLSVYPL